ncbi:hypothetical protein WA026_009718 [Henosepilachna vigintioctopunctata]|uniref:Cytochrome P450 n=1 Tax=Henosepilachna vigintioctopunctata TaxID=420089 RepID=A0AAW1TR06_9CUCU
MYIVGTLFLVLFFYMFIKFMRNFLYIKESVDKFPGPHPIFFLGNALDFLGDEGMINIFYGYIKQYGSIVKGRMGPLLYGLVISDFEILKHILLGKSNLSKGRFYDMTKSWLGEGLLTSEGDKWKPQRKMVNPAFSNEILKDFVTIFNSQAEVLTEKFKKLIPVETFNIHDFLSLCSLDITCETVMGVSINAQSNDSLEYVRCVKQMCSIIGNRSMSIWKMFDPLFWLSSDYQTQRKCLKIVKNHVNQVIAMRKEQRKNINKKAEEDEFGRKRKVALLDILLEYSESEMHLDQKEIEDQVHTFMFAGHDTSTTTMDFVIYELARNPKIQELAFQEQKRIFAGDRHRDVNLVDIRNMKYLDMVIKETLRLYPPVSLIGRQIDEEIKFRDVVIPNGIAIILFIYGLHRDPQLFPNPDVFNPLRFENPDDVKPFSFIPFSTGPRNCIGQKFAMYEMTVILSRLLRNFEFFPAVPEHTLDLRAEVVLTSRNGVNVKIDARRW